MSTPVSRDPVAFAALAGLAALTLYLMVVGESIFLPLVVIRAQAVFVGGLEKFQAQRDALLVPLLTNKRIAWSEGCFNDRAHAAGSSDNNCLAIHILRDEVHKSITKSTPHQIILFPQAIRLSTGRIGNSSPNPRRHDTR